MPEPKKVMLNLSEIKQAIHSLPPMAKEHVLMRISETYGEQERIILPESEPTPEDIAARERAELLEKEAEEAEARRVAARIDEVLESLALLDEKTRAACLASIAQDVGVYDLTEGVSLFPPYRVKGGLEDLLGVTGIQGQDRSKLGSKKKKE